MSGIEKRERLIGFAFHFSISLLLATSSSRLDEMIVNIGTRIECLNRSSFMLSDAQWMMGKKNVKIFIATLVMMQESKIVYWSLVGAYASGITSASTTGVK